MYTQFQIWKQDLGYHPSIPKSISLTHALGSYRWIRVTRKGGDGCMWHQGPLVNRWLSISKEHLHTLH